MFKKQKKTTPKQEFINFLENQIIKAQNQKNSCIIFPIENSNQTVWAKEYAKQKNLSIIVSHQTDKTVYYKMRGWIYD